MGAGTETKRLKYVEITCSDRIIQIVFRCDNKACKKKKAGTDLLSNKILKST